MIHRCYNGFDPVTELKYLYQDVEVKLLTYSLSMGSFLINTVRNSLPITLDIKYRSTNTLGALGRCLLRPNFLYKDFPSASGRVWKTFDILLAGCYTLSSH